MHHNITSGSFTYQDADGKDVTIKGSLVVPAPEDGDYSPNRNIGPVQFVTASDDGGSSKK